LRFTPPPTSRTPPPVDAYSLRLVSGRRLYDRGVLVHHSPALAHLVPDLALRANPRDLDQVGIKPGQRARVTSPRGSLVLAVEPDPTIPRGTASLDANLPGDGPADLIDAAAPVTEVRLESVAEGG
jgi:anaerobic selenocysteine-containing dehydrogenase